MSAETENAFVPIPQSAEIPLSSADLPESDGEPLETYWHHRAMSLLIEALSYHWRERDDFFVAGDMFIYYSREQAEQVIDDLATGRKWAYRGPDFFVVKGVPKLTDRQFWVVWEEDGKYPDLVIELLSPITAITDRTFKKDIYERIFKTAEYFLYDPATKQFEGWRLRNGRYEPVALNEHGWIWSAVLNLWIGNWKGEYFFVPGIYPRYFDSEGNLVLIGAEAEAQRAEQARLLADAAKQRADAAKQRADAAEQRADAAKQRADALEAEIARLRARITVRKGDKETS